MYLFLTSSPCDDNVPAGVKLPCIFFEKNLFVVNLRCRVAPNPRLVVVAADPENDELNDEMASTFAGCFAYHGMEPSRVELLDGRTRARAAEMIEKSDIVLIGGGHVPTQNAFFEEIGLRELLKDYEGVVIGISAGSMNCAETVYAQPECPGESVDPECKRFIPGLGLTHTNILPHYQKARYYELDGKRLYEDITYADSFKSAFIAMPDSSYILVEDNKEFLYGEGYCIFEGKIEKISSESECIRLWI